MPDNANDSLSPQNETAVDTGRMYHELKVHQIELEIQNEELRRAQAELEQSKIRYAELYHRAPAGYITVNDKGVIVEANRTACTMLGEPEGELYNKPLTMIILPDDQYTYFLHRKRLKDNGGIVRCELRLVRRGRGPFWAAFEFYLDTVNENTELVRIFFSDIDDRKGTEAALHESEKRYRILFETMSQGVIYQDAHGQVLSLNPAAEKILGLTYSQLRQLAGGQALWNAIREDGTPFPASEHPSHLALQSGREVRNVIMGIHVAAESSFRWILVNAMPLLRLGEVTPYQVYTTIQDISDLKRIEAQNIASREEAEKANQAKTDFLACMSHELRTPLNAIMGFGQLLDIDPKLDAEQRDSVREILTAGKQLLGLVDALLNLSDLESGTQTPEYEVFDVNRLIDEVLSLVAPLAAERSLEMHNRSQTAVQISADRRRLRQALFNLLTNAIKYNKHNGTIDLEVSTTATSTEIRVRDSGIGIDADHLADLFKPFSHFGEDSGVYRSRGIGLAITKHLVESMHGQISVSSQLGSGSIFTLVFPHVEEVPRHA